jgi:hypothetical protein
MDRLKRWDRSMEKRDEDRKVVKERMENVIVSVIFNRSMLL